MTFATLSAHDTLVLIRSIVASYLVTGMLARRTGIGDDLGEKA